MKKMGQMVRNLYRITLSKPTGMRSEKVVNLDGGDPVDNFLRKAVVNDKVDLEPDPEILKMLSGRVENKKRPVKENSLFFIPGFLSKNFELKMAVLTLIFVITLGVNPTVQYQENRKISPFSLADSLIDSSRLDKSVFEPLTP